ncbi:MAG: hypothetical protein AAF418_05130 [Pseudomonadota bacterium]
MCPKGPGPDAASTLCKNPGNGIDALISFAHQDQKSADGWTSASAHPASLLCKTTVRLPAHRMDVL